ncbi:MAG: MarR family winged helix-turn-helix transcriptional regulator [Geminicoccaceae bacterium]
MQDPRPDRNFGFLVHDVARLMRVAYDRRTRELGLTRSQWWVLNNLYFNEGIIQSELADLLDIEKPTLGRLLDRLEDKGWLERRGDPGDRRAKRVYLTGNVQGLMQTLRRLAADLRASALDGLDEAERERLLDALRIVKGNLLRLNGNGGLGAPEAGTSEGTDAGRSASAA